MRSVFFIITLLLLQPLTSYPQTFYANTTSSLYKITLSSTSCNEIEIPTCIADIFALASDDQNLYFYSVEEAILYKSSASNPSVCEKIMDLETISSLTVGANGLLYAAIKNQLIVIDPASHTKTNYDMPFTAAGDLIFYNSKLYLAATPNIIAEINLSNPMESVEYFKIPESNIFGLTAATGACGEGRMFALASGFSGTDLIELDMHNAKSLGIACNLKNVYNDAAALTENIVPKGLIIDSLVKRDICKGSNLPSHLKIYTSGVGGEVTYTLNNTLSNKTGIFEDLPEGRYNIHIAVTDRCYKDTMAVIDRDYCNVFFPSAFTPNNDGINDVFKPLGLKPLGDLDFIVYNRWGKKVYAARQFEQGWDGTTGGGQQPAGVYTYTLFYNDKNNKPVLLRGTVVLIR